MELSAVKQIARSLMDAHGLKEWDFLFNRRKRGLGVCYSDRKCIQLSEFHATHDDEAKIRETILHEIAHALAGHSAGHGPVWQEVAARVGCTEIARCGRGNDEYHKPAGTWYAICPTCRKVYEWYRKPGGRKRVNTYWCMKCGRRDGRLIPVPRKVESTEKPQGNGYTSIFD